MSVREITDHEVDPQDPNLTILVLDAPSHGGACHNYSITGGSFDCEIHFQEGPIKEHGVNGVTQEALIAIAMDRLRSFQAGDFACKANQIALEHLEKAQEALLDRTRERMARHVEGTRQQ